MVRIAVVLLCIAFPCPAFSQTDEIVVGETLSIHSEVLGEDRMVRIHLPEGYRGSEDRYPTVYVLDGRDHFLHTSAATEFLARANLAPSMIVVAILNVNRRRDMTVPLDDQEIVEVGNGAERFTSFIRNELRPHIDWKYRTEGFNILIGHSLAGFFTVHTLLTHPGLFDAYVAVSPSLQWKDEYLLTQIEKQIENEIPFDKFLYLTYSRENNVNLLTSVDRFIKLLEGNPPQGLEWDFAYMAEDVHPTTSYRSFYDGLEWLFNGWRFDSTVPGADAHRMRAQYALLTQKFGFEAKPAETWCYIIGHETLSSGQTSDAIEYFKYYVESYPKSSYAHSSLAEAYAEAGQIERAIESCEKSLGFNPENSIAQRLLERIRGTR